MPFWLARSEAPRQRADIRCTLQRREQIEHGSGPVLPHAGRDRLELLAQSGAVQRLLRHTGKMLDLFGELAAVLQPDRHAARQRVLSGRSLAQLEFHIPAKLADRRVVERRFGEGAGIAWIKAACK